MLTKLQRQASKKLNDNRPDDTKSTLTERIKHKRSELASLKETQKTSKVARGDSLDRIKLLETQAKEKQAHTSDVRNRTKFKSVTQVDAEISRLNQQMEIGKLTLVEEKKTASEVSLLRKQRKALEGVSQTEMEIQSIKTSIAELKSKLNSPEQKQGQQAFEKLQAELDKLQRERHDLFQAFNTYKDELRAAKDRQDNAYRVYRDFQNEYQVAMKKFHEFERLQKKKRDEKRAEERLAYQEGKRRELEQRCAGAERSCSDATTHRGADEYAWNASGHSRRGVVFRWRRW